MTMYEEAYPLLFTYRDIIQGDGFVAGVEVHGRALMVREDDGQWWIYGVNPGGFSDGSSGQKDAAAAFRKSYTEILRDLASEVTSVDELTREVVRFFVDDSEELKGLWDAAVQKVRQEELSLDWLPRPSSADHAFGVKVYLKYAKMSQATETIQAA